MKSYKNVVLTFLLSTCIFCGKNFAQTTSAGSSNGQFKFGISERFRLETWDNSTTLSRAAKAGTSYIRFRTSLMGQWMPWGDGTFELGVKLTNEFRNYLSPSTNAFYINEVFFDQLYVKWNTKSFLDGVLTVGRQNITLGEGFLVQDGSPLDGSRAIYFNALRYDWNINSNNNISFFGLYSPRTDKLPVLNGNDIDPAYEAGHTWNLIEQAEAGGGIYYTGKMPFGNLQSYYLRKDYIEPDKNLGQINSSVNTIGSRLNINLNNNLSTTFEGAYQFGKSDVNNSSAYGGYLYIDYNTLLKKVFMPKTLSVGMIYLSGDDPSTKDNEGWDPMFSRWPKWSESYALTLGKEFNKLSYWSNMASFYTSLKFYLDDQLSFNFDYHHLIALQDANPASIIPAGGGHTRGDLIMAKLLMDINKNLSGHLLFEHFMPGNYYFSGANASNWTRVELTYIF